jgi:hypothetical protein
MYLGIPRHLQTKFVRKFEDKETRKYMKQALTCMAGVGGKLEFFQSITLEWINFSPLD